MRGVARQARRSFWRSFRLYTAVLSLAWVACYGPTLVDVGSSPLPGDDDASNVGDDDASPWSPSPAGDDDTTRAPGAPTPLGVTETPPLWGTPPPLDDDLPSPAPGDDDTVPPGEDPPDPPDLWKTGSMLVSDSVTACVSLVRMGDSAVVWRHSAFDPVANYCDEGVQDVEVHEAHYVVHDDMDYVDYVMSSGSTLRGALRRVSVENPSTPVFELSGFDFSGVPEAGCDLPAETTCGEEADLPDACWVWFPHSFRVLEDDPSQGRYSALIADHRYRILSVTLDYGDGGSCARVNWVLDKTNPDWNPTCMPNHVQVVEDGGSTYLVVTCRNLNAELGQGQIQLYRQEDEGTPTGWPRVWTFPAQQGEAPVYLNSPHHGQLLPLDGSRYQLVYAHSDGLASSWGEGDRGTIGTALLESVESAPDYLADEYIETVEGAAFGHVKSVEVTPDGHRLVSDFGAYTPDSESVSRIYVLEPQGDLQNNDVAGYWDPEHQAQNLCNVTESIEAISPCDWGGLYSSYWIDPRSYGRFLRSLPFSAGDSCGGQPAADPRLER